MATLTPVSKIPYPVGTDRVADGDNAMRAIAMAVDGLNWTALTPNAGFSGQLWYARRSNMVSVALNLSLSAGVAANVAICNLPNNAAAEGPPSGALLIYSGQGGGVLRTVYLNAASGGAVIYTGEAWTAAQPFWGTLNYPALYPQV